MNKKSIQRHEECLKNREAYARKIREEALRGLAFADREDARNRFYFQQIEQAKLLGKVDFDSDRFLSKKKPL